MTKASPETTSWPGRSPTPRKPPNSTSAVFPYVKMTSGASASFSFLKSWPRPRANSSGRSSRARVVARLMTSVKPTPSANKDVVLVTGRVPSQQSHPTQPAQEEPTESPLVVAGLHAHTRRVDAHADGTEPGAQEVFKSLLRKTHPLLDDAMIRHRAILRRAVPSSAGRGSGRADRNPART
jgi:hypothetical protein